MSNKVLEDLSSIATDTLDGKYYDNREFGRKMLNYPAMMVPSVQESIIKTLIQDLPENASLIDPFMGASNTLVTGMRNGVNVFGQDINPLSVLISQVKTHIYDIDELQNSYCLIRDYIKTNRIEKIDVDFKNINKWFREDVKIELSQIRSGIFFLENIWIRKFYWVVLAEVIRLTSNDRTSTFKMHIREKKDIYTRKIDPKKLFFKIAQRSIDDIQEIYKNLVENNYIDNANYRYNVDIRWGDSKAQIESTEKFDLLVTSPPYGDNQTTVTYGQFSYLPLQWIPTQEIDPDLRLDYLSVIQTIDKLSLGGQIDKRYLEKKDYLFSISPTLEKFFSGFSSEEEKRAKKVVMFVDDLRITIDNIINSMNHNAYLVWTIGNRTVNGRKVENDNILIELLRNKNIELFHDLEREILSKRMPGKNNYSSMMNKEKILIFKNNG